jgi:hypothetical protein
MKFGIYFGAFEPPIVDQLPDGYFMGVEDAERLQGHADAIVRLCLARVLSKGETRQAEARLIKKIAKAIKKD